MLFLFFCSDQAFQAELDKDTQPSPVSLSPVRSKVAVITTSSTETSYTSALENPYSSDSDRGPTNSDSYYGDSARPSPDKLGQGHPKKDQGHISTTNYNDVQNNSSWNSDDVERSQVASQRSEVVGQRSEVILVEQTEVVCITLALFIFLHKVDFFIFI